MPDDFFEETCAPATPDGWAGPRILLLKDKNGLDVYSDDILDESIKESDSREAFLAVLAKKVFDCGVDPEKIIDLVLKHHNMKEQHNSDMYFDVIDQLHQPKPESRFFDEVMKIYRTQNQSYDPPGWVRILNSYFANRPSAQSA